MTDLIEYMKLCVMNTHGEEQDKCLKILAILEEKLKNLISTKIDGMNVQKEYISLSIGRKPLNIKRRKLW